MTAPLPSGDHAEIAIKRSLFDQILLRRAAFVGAEVREGETLLSARRNEHWQISTAQSKDSARILVAADGRNSTVARLCHLMPSKGPDRVALQTHVPLPNGFGDRVVLQLLREGYSGQAPVGDGLLNLCLVSRPNDLATVKRWAEREFSIPTDHSWRNDRAAGPSRRCPRASPDCFWWAMRRGLLSHLPEKEFTTPSLRRAGRGSDRVEPEPRLQSGAPEALCRPALDQPARPHGGAASAPHEHPVRRCP